MRVGGGCVAEGSEESRKGVSQGQECPVIGTDGSSANKYHKLQYYLSGNGHMDPTNAFLFSSLADPADGPV